MDFHVFPVSCFIENSQGCNNQESITPSTAYALYEGKYLQEYKAKKPAGLWGEGRGRHFPEGFFAVSLWKASSYEALVTSLGLFPTSNAEEFFPAILSENNFIYDLV